MGCSLRWAVLMTLILGFFRPSGATGAGGASLEIENLSQFDLLEVRLHPEPSYMASRNQLGEPLPSDGTIVVAAAMLQAHTALYVTVIRERVRDGERIAFTTVRPIPLRPGHSILRVLDQEFRLEFIAADDDASAATGCSVAGS